MPIRSPIAVQTPNTCHSTNCFTLFIKLKPDINKEDLHESKLIKSPNKENNFDENDYQTPSYNNKQFMKQI